MSGMSGKTALIVSSGAEVAAQIAFGLADQGAAIGLIGPSDVPATAMQGAGGKTALRTAALDDRAAVAHAGRKIAEALGAIDLIVLPILDPKILTPSPLAEQSEADWIERCETPLRMARIGLQVSFDLLRARGGQIILLVPTIAITGGVGLAAYSAVGEGVRSMAKAVARRWGADGIRVNCLALTPEQLSPSSSAADPATARQPRALGRVPALRAEVAPFIAMLASPQAQIVTGATIMLDGGELMSL